MGRILKYLKQTSRMRILYKKGSKLNNIGSFSDTDWVRLKTNKRSTSNYGTFLGGTSMT